MSPPTICELCRPRADVLEGKIRDEDFAADLSQVLKGTAPELYKNPALFFANSHPTRRLRDLIKAVAGRLAGADSHLGSILRLDTSYGGGKTHAQIKIINLHPDGTVEADVYRSLKSRIAMFEQVVGKLQPILAKASSSISLATLASRDQREKARASEWQRWSRSQRSRVSISTTCFRTSMPSEML
jgi:hypothetical protein